LIFFVALVVDGIPAGSLYALVALAFVVVYKAARMINFALGEWMMFAPRLVAAGCHAFGVGLAGSIGFGCAGMLGIAVLFNRAVLRRLVGRPLISLIMVTYVAGVRQSQSGEGIAAGVAARAVMTTTQIDSSSVLTSQVTKYVCVNSVWKLCSVGGRWNQKGD